MYPFQIEVSDIKRVKSPDLSLAYIRANGRPRRIRINRIKLVFIAITTLFFMICFGYVAGDYTRVQIDRLHHYFQAKRLLAKQESLASDNIKLKRKISSLERESERVQDLEQNLKTQLAQLKDAMSAAASLGVLPEKQYKRDGKASSGIGGAEVNCLGLNKDACQRLNKKSEVGYRPSSFGSQANTAIFEENSRILDELKFYTEALEVVPIGAPVRSSISSHFGPRYSPFSNRVKHHQGSDFTVPYGTKVVCTAAGTVIDVKRDRTYGLMVDVRHSNNVITRYAHLSKVLVSKHQAIKRGGLLGLVGSTGRSTGPHLHYEVRVKGKAINPAALVNLPTRLNTAINRTQVF